MMTVIGEEQSVVNMSLNSDNKAQYYFGRGKLLLSGEYVVLDGAQALAIPLKVGQSLTVHYSQSFSPCLTWKSYNEVGELWLEARFEYWRFNCLDPNPSAEVLELQKILRAARKLNAHFLREEGDVLVETRLGFPLTWGLGSSSSLLYNIAQWAYVSPFQLQFMTFGGSGYDVACAQSDGPILYSLDASGPHWSPTLFDPSFKDKLYFIYLGQKQNSRDAVSRYQEVKSRLDSKLVERISEITAAFCQTQNLSEFNQLIVEHENLIGGVLDIAPLKSRLFSDYWGEVKSLGAWGGDFALVTSDKGAELTKTYFANQGIEVFVPYSDIVHNITNVHSGMDNAAIH
jgi:mevalonate kinase